MDLAKGIRLIHGVEPPCMRIARRMDFSSAPGGLGEAVSGDAGEEKVGCLAQF
jgi:hypothetical protein